MLTKKKYLHDQTSFERHEPRPAKKGPKLVPEVEPEVLDGVPEQKLVAQVPQWEDIKVDNNWESRKITALWF